MKIEKYLKDKRVTLEFLDFFLGKHLGSGVSRDVYQHNFDPKLVVKVENREALGDNWAELRIWHAIKHTEHAKWFAPCSYISTNGIILLQTKTEQLDSKPESKIPDLIPAFFTDVKPSNFGWIGNQMVCHDYSHCVEMFSSFGLTKKTIKTKDKLKWS